VARHGGERMSQAMVIQTGGNLLGAGMGNTDPRLQSVALLAYGVGSKVGFELPHSREQESEADHIGLIYMARAGYDAEQSVKFWERFAAFNQQQGGETPWFLRTHPLDADRINQLKQWMPEAKAQGRAGFR
jgi:predicted Zn-dependent protease